MARRRKYTGDDDLGWSRYSRKFDDVPLPPAGSSGTPGTQTPGGPVTPGGSTAGTQTPGYNAPGQPGTAGAQAEKKAAAAKKAAAKKAAAKKTASSSSTSSYEKILAEQKAEAEKTKQRAAQKYTRSAEAMQGQARALRSLLGLSIGKGDDRSRQGGMRTAGPGSQYGVKWESNWTSKNKDWTRPGQLRGGGLGGSTAGNGIRTGTDIKYPPGMGTGQGGGNGPNLGGPKYGPDDRRPFEDPHRNRRGA